MKVYATTLALVAPFVAVKASIAPPSLYDTDGPPCVGLHLDFNRIVDVTKKDLNAATGSLGEGRSYGVNTIVPVTKFGSTSECMLKRHRLKETKEGVPIFGADVIVTVDDCTPSDQTVAGSANNEALAGVNFASISGLEGKSYAFIEVASGYEPTYSVEEATAALSVLFGTPTDKVGTLQLTVFPSFEQGDLLSYKSEVWVSRDNEVELYDVFINANTLEPIQTCTKINKQRFQRRSRLRQLVDDERNLQTTSSCGSCADQSRVQWDKTRETSCPINALYLNSTGKTATCIVGKKTDGTEVLGPGSIASLHYDGTYDCNSRDSGCAANILPTTCADALSDVHYGVTMTMKFMQDYLGVMGGLKVDAASPLSTSAFVHFDKAYCNAFFTTQTNSLYFGDCDCKMWSPLTSIDVAAHEYSHGVTSYSSDLIYQYQPGGLNEGFSDIMGAVMEFYINDNIDTPDFDVGESLIKASGLQGTILRYMEDPTRDSKSIGNVCSFTNDMNVHYSSGIPNKAFVKSVRACAASTCSPSVRDCVLLVGPIFMYANIHRMTSLGGYIDAATATCLTVPEYFQAKSPSTTCTADQVKGFVRAGWESVGLSVNSDTCIATSPGCTLPGIPSGAGGGGISNCRIFKWMKSAVGWVTGRFSN